MEKLWNLLSLNFSIREKVWLLSFVILAIALDAIGLGLIQHRNYLAGNDAVEHASRVSQEALRVQVAYQRQMIEWKNLLVRGEVGDQYDEYFARFEEEEKATRKLAHGLEGDLGESSEASLLVRAFLREHHRLGKRYREALTAYRLAETDPHITTDKYMRGVEQVPAILLKKLLDRVAADKERALAAIEEKLATDVRLAVIIFAVANAAALLLAFGVAQGIKRSVRQLQGAMERVRAERDLTAPVPVDGNDELSGIAGHFSSLMAEFRAILANFRSAGDEVTGVAGRVAGLSEGTRAEVAEQHAKTRSMVEGIRRMAETVERISEHARQAAARATAADGDAVRGREAVMATLASMESLTRRMEGANDAVRSLAQESDAIGTVLDVIDGVAEQTNLLALNAAIEAARAGEQGRGFAVVADEVRTLATRTRRSTEEIQAMIERLQKGATDAVAAMDRGREHAAGSLEQARDAGVRLEAITGEVAAIREMNSEISRIADEQSEVAEAMERDVQAIQNVADRTAGGADTTASLSGQLAEMSTGLRQQIGVYRI
ncbi:methyl-accepting chemotaxis protein [Endothiovibrio diazotrophicus]